MTENNFNCLIMALCFIIPAVITAPYIGKFLGWLKKCFPKLYYSLFEEEDEDE